MKKSLAILLLLIITLIQGCYNLELSYDGEIFSGTEVLFAEIDPNHALAFSKRERIFLNDPSHPVSYKRIENKRGTFIGKFNERYKFLDAFYIYELKNGDRILFDARPLSSLQMKSRKGFIVDVELIEEAEKFVGKTIWTNLSSERQLDLYTEDGSFFDIYEQVRVVSVRTYYRGERDALWFEIEGDGGKRGWLNCRLRRLAGVPLQPQPPINPTFLSENPIPAEWSDEIVKAIKEKKIQLGMNTDQVRLSWGKPNDISRSISAMGVIEIWQYGSATVTFDNGKIFSIDQY
tara:strand:+ start:315 stop:1187 length:873 start_codon:yes stop_codon:yes gene_type:complete